MKNQNQPDGTPPPQYPKRKSILTPEVEANFQNAPQVNVPPEEQPEKLTPAEEWAEQAIASSLDGSRIPKSDLTVKAEGRRDREMDEARRAGKPWIHPHVALAKKQKSEQVP